jgi:hypothetical protein
LEVIVKDKLIKEVAHFSLEIYSNPMTARAEYPPVSVRANFSRYTTHFNADYCLGQRQHTSLLL